MSVLMQRFLLAALSVLGILILFSLLYAVLGRRFTDKIVAANMIGTLGINMIVILAVLIGTDYILDIGNHRESDASEVILDIGNK